MSGHFQYRRDTHAGFTASNPLLYVGEPALELDTLKMKMGDGITRYNSLDFWYDPASGGGGGGIADFAGPAVIGRIDTSVGDYQTLDSTDLQGWLDFVTSTDLGDVSDALTDHIALGSNPTDVVHGINPQTTWRFNIGTGRTQLVYYTGLPAGFAPAGFIEHKMADGAYYVRGDSFTWQRIAPLDSFTPYTPHIVLNDDAGFSWAMPAGPQELFNNQKNRVVANVLEDDLTTRKFTQARLVVDRVITAGPAGSKLRLYFSGSGGPATAHATTAIDVAVSATGAAVGTFQNLANGVYTFEAALTPVPFTEFLIEGIGGDGSTIVLNGLRIDLR